MTTFSPTRPLVEPSAFKAALASWPSGVAVVATRSGGFAHATTVSSFSSVSLEPPMVLVCLTTGSRLGSLARDAGAFTVSVLAEGQDDVSKWFASSSREPSEELTMNPLVLDSGLPAIEGAAAVLECEIAAEVPAGDHVILIGNVVAARGDGESDPLIYHARNYWRLTR